MRSLLGHAVTRLISATERGNRGQRHGGRILRRPGSGYAWYLVLMAATCVDHMTCFVVLLFLLASCIIVIVFPKMEHGEGIISP
ncbi:hypothetical protein CONLIGDRAFT_319839 [Coniochaeta ligniaria NRRL 30616]|uniref:Uncharacterized protein n=1 Tax=Coniochaeta ligniaria NRRL 30616 TaxID=1408157 RepID=A0A1J7I4A3_9PEZI|nr:hypothetical protein CONLIGDRAFT_319839 [Coniochaeta ligniaria NRRL 30616]